jgi:glycosyltransferase involved in cell wall biosynthesis
MFAYNEATHLEDVVTTTLATLREHCGEYELIVVDDGSDDDTAAILDRLAAHEPALRVFHHAQNRGIGEAVHTAYAAVRMDYVCILPADGQVRMSEYIKLIPEAEAGADLVLARYQNRAEADSLGRVVLSRGLRLFMWTLLGVGRHIDAAFLFRRSLLEEIPLKSRTFFVNLELPLRILRGQYRVAEVPMQVFPRISGRSKVLAWRKVMGVARDVVSLRLALWREAAARSRDVSRP